MENQKADREDLEAWLESELQVAVARMLESISATSRVRQRPAFGQSIRPQPGSVVASPEFGDYNPEPDYFFHWLRDSALVMDALRVLIGAGKMGAEGHAAFADFVRFSLSLSAIDATHATSDPGAVDPVFRQYLRPMEELRAVTGDKLLAETRFNPDGSLDILKWARPQLDGPALRALTLMRYWPLRRAGNIEGEAALERLIRQDLAFVRAHYLEPSFDIWEETLGRHYYTRAVHLGALIHGAAWLRAFGANAEANEFDAAANALRPLLGAHWSDAQGLYRTCADRVETVPDHDPDIAVILGVLHAGLREGTHSIADPKVEATLSRLEEHFARSFEINKHLPAGAPPALGRYPSDCYFGGGAFYLGTLAAAEFYFRLAEAAQHGASEFSARADEFLATVRRFTPPSGELSEQFDRATGAQTSARNLAWSYAAFITAVFARRASR